MDENRRNSTLGKIKGKCKCFENPQIPSLYFQIHFNSRLDFSCTVNIVKECSLKNASFHNPVHNIVFLLLPEPIIKPVKNKQFTLMEQELPATVYDME